MTWQLRREGTGRKEAENEGNGPTPSWPVEGGREGEICDVCVRVGLVGKFCVFVFLSVSRERIVSPYELSPKENTPPKEDKHTAKLVPHRTCARM